MRWNIDLERHGLGETWTWRHGHGDIDMETWTWRHGSEEMDMETWNLKKNGKRKRR
jgi:hypothetical protein